VNDELARLYQQVILEHNKSPRNYGPLEGATHEARADNPLCGDVVTLRLVVADGRIQAVRFEARGCAISRATASLMTSAIAGGTPQAAARLRGEFEGLMAAPADPERAAVLGELTVVEGVRDFPSRIACAVLPWRALEAALGGKR